MKLVRLLIPILVLLLSGCAKNIQNKEAVKKAVVEHLSKKSDLAVTAMDIDVTNVTFKDKEAEAMVSFKPKGMDASSGMQIRYALEQKGGLWVVKGKADSGASQHGAAATETPAMPPGHPPAGAGTAKK